MITCADITRTATEYLEGSFTFVERVKFQLHLGMCPGCRTYLKQMKQTVETLGHLPERPEDGDEGAVHERAVHDRVMDKFRTWAQERRNP